MIFFSFFSRLLFSSRWGLASLVGVANGLLAIRTAVQISVMARYFTSPKVPRPQSLCGSGRRGSVPGVQRAVRDLDHSHPSSARLWLCVTVLLLRLFLYRIYRWTLHFPFLFCGPFSNRPRRRPSNPYLYVPRIFLSHPLLSHVRSWRTLDIQRHA